MKLTKIIAATLGLSLAASAASASAVDIIYPQIEANDRRYDYPMDLLRLALDKSGVEYNLVPKKELASHERMSVMMEENGDWTVMFLGANPDYEARLRPIRFPMYRGLLGNRIAITHKDNLPRLDEVDTVEEFMALSVCQGIGWTDTPILESAGFNVVTGEYTNLFKVAHAKRCDMYTRAVFEPYAEVEGHADTLPNLVVDDSLLIRYRLPYFMYVDPSQEELALAIERGLQAAMEDGSFQALFENAPVIAEAKAAVNEAKRVCIEIDNPYLTDETRAIPDEYWAGFSFDESGSSGSCRLLTN